MWYVISSILWLHGQLGDLPIVQSTMYHVRSRGSSGRGMVYFVDEGIV